MVLCFVLNDAYSHPFFVALYSLFGSLKKIPPSQVEVIIIHGGISKSLQKELKRVARKLKFKLVEKKIEPSSFQHLPLKNHWKPEFYYRFAISELNYSKILFIDCDLLVLDDVSELWNLPLNGHVLGAVQNPSIVHFGNLGLQNANEYFNAGIMLIDLEKWKSERVSEQCLDLLRLKGDDFLWGDQDALNQMVQGNWKQIPLNWNLQSEVFKAGFEGGGLNRTEIENALISPKIIHFTGMEKPWNYYTQHPFADEYLKTAWKGPYFFKTLFMVLKKECYQLYKGVFSK